MHFADRSPTVAELARFGPNFKESRSVAEDVALDALTMLVDPSSGVDTFEAGKTLSLKMASGPEGSLIKQKASFFGLHASSVLNDFGEVAALRDKDVVALSFFHLEGQNLRANRLAVKMTPNGPAVKPSPFTIATEEYPFTYRIVAWTSTKPTDEALSFVKFITSNAGQAVVQKCGFVDLRLKSIPGQIDPRILAALGTALGLKSVSAAERLSTNIRFAVGDAQLDLKAQADLERITREAALNYPNYKVVILGFTDNDGGPVVNQPLSVKRAEGVATELRRSKVDTRSGGLGDSFPIDSNDTIAGKARNRRAEVWVVKP
jgi:outer membrane protein OmpA-like peptidoglycan-associated protein